ncbi:6,7-dimethyl-8-ribityllumazine synthase [Flavisolibacter ginsengisoli]|jgi:6,7-dimethyl-8-ribityllumazine synthase|uniref:6,7-dimethyl-8-ribityllumazine synthase n=1 Tax=Flavisolibacter ginsengisoli DSM 18119 TaxID=1121884 RepID=A0A1M4WRK2_9BACT|nr:6,7-dimethyl-8-ribityllumazine synthase [Flavisolibacter ginsengisoli]SHE83683.1 6,7-dimethyl-8-ribityllumazine synthase [Flavisolibacter ginsengisoli DSM 18119]
MADIANSKLLQEIEGIQQLKDALVVLVKTEWNAAIIDELESGCRKMLEGYGIASKTIVVPGAIEIPFAIKQYATCGSPAAATAFIALACVIRGGTPHFDYVCQSVTDGITQLNLLLEVPVIFGVLTVDNEQQARERIGGIHGHKGEEAAVTALKMMLLNKEFKEGKQ